MRSTAWVRDISASVGVGSAASLREGPTWLTWRILPKTRCFECFERIDDFELVVPARCRRICGRGPESGS